MADTTATLSFNDDLFTDARGETGRYTGTITVDYTTGTYSGRVNAKGDGFSASVGLSGHIGSNAGTYAIDQGNFIVGWTGQQPTTASVEFKLNNNQDFRTSLNPAGQRNQPVTSSGSGSTGGGSTGGGSTGSPPASGTGDVVATLRFNDDLFTDKRGEKGRYTGSITVDYTTGTYSGRVNAKGDGFSASIGLSGHIGSNNGTYAIDQGNFVVGWTGQQPTTASVEFKLNNNQDFRTSLNPAGQRNQPVASSGNASSTQAARADDATAATTPHVVDATASGQTLSSSVADIFANHGAPSNTFVFDPGYGQDVVRLFRAGGADHDTLSFAGSDFGDSIAEVLRHAHNVGDGVVIADPTTGDTVRLTGVTKAQLAHNPGDFTFHS